MKIQCAASISIVLATVLLLISCKRPQTSSRDERKSVAEDVSLDGQVFIVTRGAENVRLGELHVYVVERRLFDDLHLLKSALKEQQQIRRAFDVANKAGHECEQVVGDIKTEYAKLVFERDRLVKALPGFARLHETYHELLAEIKKRDAVLDQNEAKLRQFGSDSYSMCRELENRAKELPRRVADNAYERLKPLSKVCKTDADGHFHFRCTANENFVLFTRGHRETPNRYEQYEWFVSTSSSRDSQKRAFLTNDNLLESPSANNVLAPIFASLGSAEFEIPRSQSRELAARAELPREPQWASPGTFFFINYASVRTATGVVRWPPGTEIHERQRIADRLLANYGKIEFETDLNSVTDNADLTAEIRNADAQEQSQVAARVVAEQGAGRLLKEEESAVNIAIPADGPSFGTAPAGTCT